ncbi:MAG: class I SAM-dependent methyltransferase [Patescibacteria group bacterium]|nr:class I SAM-dependent methyltransferase [Patescibacteria group bacterium]
MKEYFCKSVKNYKQSSDKAACLFPALERTIDVLDIDSKTVLDLGCGDGILYPMLESRGFEYQGVDVSDDMVKQARDKNPK